MILDFIVNIAHFITNVIGGTWNFIYRILVPKKRRNPKLIYRKRRYRG